MNVKEIQRIHVQQLNEGTILVKWTQDLMQ
jgi:hypothetical protein